MQNAASMVQSSGGSSSTHGVLARLRTNNRLGAEHVVAGADQFSLTTSVQAKSWLNQAKSVVASRFHPDVRAATSSARLIRTFHAEFETSLRYRRTTFVLHSPS
jgi:hypothetical protein